MIPTPLVEVPAEVERELLEVPAEVERELLGDATYDAADNKIRMRFASRLPKELYERVRAAGFIWAAKQELFVAPAWSPEREDLAEELCGEVGDEGTSLVERAEERADRFEDYGHKRAAESDHEAPKIEAISIKIHRAAHPRGTSQRAARTARPGADPQRHAQG